MHREHNPADSPKEKTRNPREGLPLWACKPVVVIYWWPSVVPPAQRCSYFLLLLLEYLCQSSLLTSSVTDTDLCNRVYCEIVFTSAIFLWLWWVQDFYFFGIFLRINSVIFPFIRGQTIRSTIFNLTNMGKYKSSWCWRVSSISDSLHNLMAHD